MYRNSSVLTGMYSVFKVYHTHNSAHANLLWLCSSTKIHDMENLERGWREGWGGGVGRVCLWQNRQNDEALTIMTQQYIFSGRPVVSKGSGPFPSPHGLRLQLFFFKPRIGFSAPAELAGLPLTLPTTEKDKKKKKNRHGVLCLITRYTPFYPAGRGSNQRTPVV